MDSSPLPQLKPEKSSTFRSDFLASIVVFLVALPLCIGIAVAVGVSPSIALITGIIGGIVVGFLAGCPLQVSGPAAGLFVVVADLISTQREKYLATANPGLDPSVLEAQSMHHALVVLGAACMVAGVLQFVAGRLRLGQWFRAVSPAVIEGMLAGIGVLILVSQLHVMLDHDPHYNGKRAQGGLEYIHTLPEAFYKVWSADTSATHHWAAATGIITILTIVLWQRTTPKKLRLIPAPLVAVLVATAVATFTGLDIRKLDVPGNLISEMTFPSAETLTALMTPSVLMSGLVIAIIASAETLLCATAIDQMQNGPRTKYDRELSAQGIGNFLCGLVGALPMTGVIVRSSANVQAGAKTQLSSILHGIWLLVFVVLLPFVLAYIPKSCLGAILVYTGYKLLNIKAIKELWDLDKFEAVIHVTTMVIIVADDLLIGVLTGVGLSALKLLYRFTRLSTKLTVSPDRKTADLRLNGAATFIRLPILAGELERVPPGARLHVHFDDLSYIDHACLELLTNWARQHEATNGDLIIDWDSLHARFHSDRHSRRHHSNGNGNGHHHDDSERIAQDSRVANSDQSWQPDFTTRDLGKK